MEPLTLRGALSLEVSLAARVPLPYSAPTTHWAYHLIPNLLRIYCSPFRPVREPTAEILRDAQMDGVVLCCKAPEIAPSVPQAVGSTAAASEATVV